MIQEYLINGRFYKLKVIWDGEFWEASYQDEGGEKFCTAYGDSPGESKRELRIAMEVYEFKKDQDNKYVKWSDLPKELQRKIKVKAKGYKERLLGEWLSDNERFERWQRWMLSFTSDVYPHKLEKSFYNSL